MFIGYDIMQNIIVKNMTNKVLEELSLTHNGVGAYVVKIKDFAPISEEKLQLYTLRVFGKSDLIMTLKYNNEEKVMVIYNDINRKDNRLIEVIITDEDEEIKVNVSRISEK